MANIRRASFAPVMLACALLGTGCTAPSETLPGSGSPQSFAPIEPSASFQLPANVDTSGDRLIVLTGDGNLVTVDPTGKNVLPFTTDADLALTIQQPVASPDGRQIAFVETISGAPSVMIERRDGTHVRQIDMQTVPFYLQWDPTSSRIAYLGGVNGAVGLGVIDHVSAGKPTDRALGTAEPLYFSWSPGGERMLVHAGSQSLGLTDLRTKFHPLSSLPGTFQAPVWLPDGRLVYVARDGKDQRLVVADEDGATNVLTTFRGGALFEASPDGKRLAYRLDGSDGSERGVFVQSLDGGKPERVTVKQTSAFFWSPTGDRLLLMAIQPGAVVKQTQRWWLWDDGRLRPVSKPFLPSRTFFQDYLPFFDQYAQTLTPWAPDGSAFAFAGLMEDGRSGAWVQRIDGSAAKLVSPGSGFVSWSPPIR